MVLDKKPQTWQSLPSNAVTGHEDTRLQSVDQGLLRELVHALLDELPPHTAETPPTHSTHTTAINNYYHRS